MSPDVLLLQVDPSVGASGVLVETARFGFAVAVAWYLLTKTTNALKDITAEISKLREEIQITRTEIGREVYETRQDVKDLQEPRDTRDRR